MRTTDFFGTADVNQAALKHVTDILGEDGLSQVFAPIDQASGLPNVAYVSDDWLALEHKHLFAKNWMFVAASAEIPNVGDIKPITIADTPIMLVRGRDDIVRGFHNVCRHRGTLLVDKPCRQKTITCPYHAWNYRLDGFLQARPHFKAAGDMERFDDANPSGLDLLPVRTETWNGCVFADLSGTAPALTDWLSPMLKRTAQYDYAHIRWAGKLPFTMESNWKLVLENFMEGYHVFAAHPRLLKHAPMNIRWSGEWLDHVFYNDYVVDAPTAGRGDNTLPTFPGLSDQDKLRGMWFAFLPNFAAQVFADQFVVLASYPIAPGKTYEEVHLFVVGDEGRDAEQYANGRQQLIDMWQDLNTEDKELLERLQQGRRSPVFPGSYMSPAWEGPAHELSQNIVRTMVADDL